MASPSYPLAPRLHGEAPIAVLLASLTFLSPLWAAGFAAAVGAPLLAHMLSKRGGQLTVFPAVRFVQQAVADTARLLRPRHWLLMLIRIAALALVVLAFMQPVWYRHAAAVPADDAGYHVVLIVDRTASMQRAVGGATLFDEARRRALALLDDLDPVRDRASVILLDGRCEPLLPEPSANFDALQAALRSAAPTHEHGRLADAVARARSLAERDTMPRRLRIDVFTDAQRTQHPENPDVLGEAITLHVVGEPDANAALLEPSVTPAHPVVGQPVTLAAEVVNFADQPARLTVAKRIGDTVQRQPLTLPPFGRGVASFRAAFDRPGAVVVEMALEDAQDVLPADDRAGRVVHVRAARPVHLVTAADRDDPATAAYFLARALAPQNAGVALSVHRPDAIREAVAQASTATGPAVLVIAEAAALDDAALDAVARHLTSGGGVLWLIDSDAAAASLRRFAERSAHAAPIMPLPSGAWDAQARRQYAIGRFDDPVLAVFEGPARAGLLEARFGATLRGTLAPQADALLTYDDAGPALAVSWAGGGRLAVWGASLRPSDTAFVKGPLFVPLVHQLLRHLAPGLPPLPNPRPGQTLTLQPTDGATLTSPSGEATPRATAPGLYALRRGDELIDGQWVQVDPAESDLRHAETDPSGAATAGATPDTAQAAAAVQVRPHGTPLWPWFMLGALALLIAEPAALLAMAARRPTVREGGGDV